jgi:FkbM family methyltransferase
MKTIVQIGAHKGYDDLTDIIKSSYNIDDINLILIEPQNEFNEYLIECYKNYNYIIENVIINTDSELNTTKFYKCSNDLDKEISSMNPQHLMKHGKNNFNEIDIPCITIDNLLLKYQIKNIDILFIDAEGYDGDIIKSINFDTFNIKTIFYENLHLNNNDEIINFLQSKNYNIHTNILNNGWTNKATKNN